MYLLQQLLSLLLISSLLLFSSCGKQEPTQTPPTAATPPAETTEKGINPPGVVTQTARQRLAPDFSIKDQFPSLYQLLGDHDQFSFIEILNIYVLPALNPNAISTESQLISLLQSRKNIMVALQQTLEKIPVDALQAKLSAIDQELRRVGIAVKSKGTTNIELEQIAHFQALEKELATEPFPYYKSFIQAQARFQSSAFPYRNMEAVKDMVVAGEKLMKEFPKSIHYRSIRTDFRTALSSFIGIYKTVEGGYSSIRTLNPMIDKDRNIAEMETHEAFVKAHPSSIYRPIIENIIASPSMTHISPANLFVIYAEQAGNIEEARKMQFEGLNQGKQFLHILPYDAGTNKDAFLIAYRFFDDENQSLAALDQLKKEQPQADIKYLNLSVNAGKLYQLGI